MIMAGVTLLRVIDIADIFPNMKPWSIGGFVTTLWEMGGALFFLKVAQMRGTTVSIEEDHVEVREWYGRRWSFSLSVPAQIDHKMGMHLPFGVLLNLPVQFQHVFRIKSHQIDTYINLEAFPNPSSEIAWLSQFLSISSR